MELVIWEGNEYRAGPFRKDWKPRTDQPPICALFSYDKNRCSECYPGCGQHIVGCIFTSNFRAHDSHPGESQDNFDYWLIREGCPQYHGENSDL